MSDLDTMTVNNLGRGEINHNCNNERDCNARRLNGSASSLPQPLQIPPRTPFVQNFMPQTGEPLSVPRRGGPSARPTQAPQSPLIRSSRPSYWASGPTLQDRPVNAIYKKNPHKETECNICLELFLDTGLNQTTLPCDHTFHSSCILQWASNAKNCPNCRKAFSTIYKDSPTISPRSLSSANASKEKKESKDKNEALAESLTTGNALKNSVNSLLVPLFNSYFV